MAEPPGWPPDRVYHEEYRGYPVYYVPSYKLYWTPATPSLALGYMSLPSIYANIDKLIADSEAAGIAPPTPPVVPPAPGVPIPTPPPPVTPPVTPPPEEAPPVEAPKPFELPGLPWYVAWLKPVLEFIGALTEAVVNFFAPLFKPLADIVTGLTELPGALAKGIIDRIGDAMKATIDESVSQALQTVSEVTGHTPEWKNALDTTLKPYADDQLAEILKNVSPEKWGKSPLSPEDAAKAAAGIGSTVAGTSIALWLAHAAAEAASLGQYEALRDLDDMVIAKLGLAGLGAKSLSIPLEELVFKRSQQFYASLFTPEIPTYADLINAVVKEVISLDDFKKQMKYQGFSEQFSQMLWDAHFKPPDWTQLLQGYYRGAITKDDLMKYKVLVDLDPRYDVVWDNLIEQIPPYSELVNELVKEVIDKPTFTKYMKWYGFDEAWATRIWDAHFIPPALGDLLTAWRRGIITEKRLDDLMVLVDLDPRFKDIFDTRKYIDPPMRVGRYMYEAGAIDEARLTEIVKREGYNPNDVEPIVAFLTTFQEREFRTSYLRALATGTIYGAYTEEELRTAVKEAGYSDAVADWMLKLAEVREKTTASRKKAPGPKLLTEGNLKRAYVMDYITEDVLRTELGVRGYPVGDVDILVRLLTEEKVTEQAGGQKLALSQSELLNAMRYNEMSEDQVRIELQLRGLTPEETDVLIRTKRKQWGSTEG